MRAEAEEASARLRDVIKAVRGCKTTAEERNVVSEESAKIRAAFRNEFSESRHRNVAKLIFFHMLGYSTSFAHMECLKLMVSKKFAEKKVGYLALTQIMGEDDPLTLMATSTIKSDLASAKSSVVQMALTAVANTASADMCRELATDILNLLGKSRASVMPRAALAACRIIRKCPELVDDFTPLATTFVDERITQLLGTGLSLIITILRTDPSKIPHFATFSAALQSSLRELVMKDSNEELDINNITDPFTQCRLLEVLRLTGKHLKQDRSDLEETLAYVLTSTEYAKQTGRCVIYECCKTILEIDASKPLRDQAISMLGKLLMSRENNTRFIALKGISREVSLNPASLSSYRASVLECVQDLDSAVARRALDLTLQLVTPENVRQITSDLLTLLVTADPEMKEAIAGKICVLAEMHSTDQRAYVDTMVRVLSLAGTLIDEDTISRTANTISTCTGLHEYAVKMLYFSARENLAQEGLVMLALWCVGEYADLLVLETGALGLQAPTPRDVVDLIATILARETTTTTKLYAVTALGKASYRLPSELFSIRGLLQPLSLSATLELQQRACEYLTLLNDEYESLRPQLFQVSQSFDKDRRATLPVAPTSIEAQLAMAEEFTELPITTGNSREKKSDLWSGDLLGIGEVEGGKASTAGAAQDLIGTEGVAFEATQPLAGAGFSQTDLLGSEIPLVPNVFAVPTDLLQPSAAPAQTDLLQALSQSSSPPAIPSTSVLPDLDFFSAPQAPEPLFSSPEVDEFSEAPSLEIPVYSDLCISIVLICSKDDPAHQEVTTVLATTVALQGGITEYQLTPAAEDYISLEVTELAGNVGAVGCRQTQTWRLTNAAQGAKHLVLTLKVEYCKDGERSARDVRVSEFTDPF